MLGGAALGGGLGLLAGHHGWGMGGGWGGGGHGHDINETNINNTYNIYNNDGGPTDVAGDVPVIEDIGGDVGGVGGDAGDFFGDEGGFDMGDMGDMGGGFDF